MQRGVGLIADCPSPPSFSSALSLLLLLLRSPDTAEAGRTMRRHGRRSGRNPPPTGRAQKQRRASAVAAWTFSELKLLRKWCQSTVNILKLTQSSVLFNHRHGKRKPAPKLETDSRLIYLNPGGTEHPRTPGFCSHWILTLCSDQKQRQFSPLNQSQPLFFPSISP